MGFFEELQARGLVAQCSDVVLAHALDERPVTAYCGFDPTAPSLHVGSLIPIVGLLRLQRAGHKPIVIVGGATALIGDPSGKSKERQVLSSDEVAVNAAGIQDQFDRIWKLAGLTMPLLLNNADWSRHITFFDFLRDVGMDFSVNVMIAKESVRSRLETREQGISFTEFSYMLLQAYDFRYLWDTYDCTLQVGGSDQWGNITAGIDLIHKTRAKAVGSHPAVLGLTFPLITTASGQKFGKTESGNVWLDPARTSPGAMYHFFFNTDDRDVGRYLRYFSLRPLNELAEIEQRSAAAPDKREAQRALAREVTGLVHGSDESKKAETAATAFFVPRDPSIAESRATQILQSVAVFTGDGFAPQSTIRREQITDEGVPLVDLLCDKYVGLCKSKSAARQQIEQGGIYLNEERVVDVNRRVTVADIADGAQILLRKGKKTFHVVRVDD